MSRFAAVLVVSLLAVGAALHAEQAGKLQVTSPAFRANGPIPASHTCDGGESIPPLAFSKIPKGTRSLALIVDDPDAPAGTWVHWVVWNIPPDTADLAEGRIPAHAVQGRNSWEKNAYGGPCPPSGTHRYFFRLFALDSRLDLPADSTSKELRRAMQGHTLGEGELMGTYGKK